MVEENLSELAGEDKIEYKLEEKGDYYLKNRELDMLKIHADVCKPISLLIENCTINELSLKSLRDVTIKNSTLSHIEGVSVSTFTNIDNITIKNTKFNPSPGEIQISRSGVIINSCEETLIKNTEIYARFGFALKPNHSTIILKDTKILHAKHALEPGDGTTLKFDNVDFTDVKNVLKKGRDYTVEEVKSTPRVILEEL